jgi:ubiquinone/menaquinone biosynthesis C-methylase UbiE
MSSVIEKISDYWDKRSLTFDNDHDTENLSVWKNFLSEIIGKELNKTVLDVGTGTGFLANMISELGYHSIGIDISKGMMEYAVRYAAEKELDTVYMNASASELPFMDNTVDFIVNSRLIWTLVEADKAVSEWTRVIKPGGKILSFIRMNEGNSAMTVCNPHFYSDDKVDSSLDLNGARIEELSAVLLKNGLTDIQFIKLPDTAKNQEIKLQEWYEPWFVLSAKKPLTRRYKEEKAMSMYWNKSAEAYESVHQIADRKMWKKVLESMIGSKKNISILDVATGTGILAQLLGEMGYKRVLGTDVSEGMMNIAIKHAKESGIENISYSYANALELPFEDNTFDVVISSRLLWTLTEPEAAIKEWHRVVKNGGKVIAINELEPGKGIAYENIAEYIKCIDVDMLPYCPVGLDVITNNFRDNGLKNIELVHMKGCHLLNSSRENWYAFIGIK